MESPVNSPALAAFMELVCCAILGTDPDKELFRGLSVDDWEKIYILARRQTVCGLCYETFCKLPDDLLPDGSLLPRWVARVNAIETTNRRMSEAVAGIISVFRNAGLTPVVQKGLSVARFYRNPELRESGDIDLWVPSSQRDKAVALVHSLGKRLKSHPDGSLSFIHRGFVVELHRRLVNVSAPRARALIETYSDLEARNNVCLRTDIVSPPPLLELLLINVHIMRHTFGTGVGLRQICDYMRAAYSLNGHYDHAEFEKACSVLGISRWTSLLNDFLVTYMHASPDMLPPSGRRKARAFKLGKLMEIVMEGGNFGHYSRRGADSSEAVAGGKLHTACMHLKRSRFALSVAPAEAFWNFARLIIGQIR